MGGVIILDEFDLNELDELQCEIKGWVAFKYGDRSDDAWDSQIRFNEKLLNILKHNCDYVT